MSALRTRPVLLLGLATLLAGCGPEEIASPEELLEDEVLASEEGKADSSSSTSTYFTVRPDLRKCLFPLCGGYFLRRANRTTIKCGDGKWSAECYVAEVDLARLKLGTPALEGLVRGGLAEERGVLRGTITKATIAGHALDRLVATEAWLAPAKSAPPAADLFYRGSPSGIVCVKAPCPTIHVAKLNSTIAANIVEPSLAAVPGSKQELAAASWELTHRSLIVVGHALGASLEVSQLFRRVLPAQ